MNKLKLPITVAAFTVCGCLILQIGVYIVRVSLEHTPAGIHDIPIFARATEVKYEANTKVSTDDCASFSFDTLDSSDAVHRFYEQALMHDDNILARKWLGDGVFYPEANPVRYYRKVQRGMQYLDVFTYLADGRTQVEIRLCLAP